jgi:hypothetical protein
MKLQVSAREISKVAGSSGGRRLSILSWTLVFIAYFLPLLLSKWIPGMWASGLFWIYSLSILAALLVLACVALFGGIRWVVFSALSRPMDPRSSRLFSVPLIGLLMFGVVVGLRTIGSPPLPTGSYALPFDEEAWLDADSTRWREGDITPRQKMLGSVVRDILPESHHSDIRRSLGASDDSGYFRSTGRDLIYILGPERDNLIGIDSEWLLIWLDESGHFERFAVMVD